MAQVNLADSVTAFLLHVLKNANFASGVVFGAVFSSVVFYFSGQASDRERQQRLGYDREREKELREQLNIKDNRITALHQELENAIKHQRR